MKNQIRNQSGFTLMELVITVAIAGVLLAVGMPSMVEFIKNGRITAVTNELVGTLMVARSEAIKQSTQVCVCPSTTVTAATPACAGNGNWERGWIAFTDFNGDCAINADALGTDVLLKVWDGSQYAGSITVRTNANAGTIAAVNSVRFNSRGAPFANGAIQQGNFSICDDRPLVADAQGNVRMATSVMVGASGRSRSTRQASQIVYTAP